MGWVQNKISQHARRLQGPQSVNFMVGHLVSAGRCGVSGTGCLALTLAVGPGFCTE